MLVKEYVVKKVWLFLGCVLFSTSHAVVLETKHISDVLCYVDKPNVLFVFDIDNTLAELEYELGSDQWFYATVKRAVRQGMDIDRAIKATIPLYLSLQLISSLKPAEKVTPFLVRSLQQQNFKVIGLTARSLSLVRRTVHQLNDIGIDLSITSLAEEEVDFIVDFPSVYKRGIIFSCNNNKGKALLAFLDYVGYHPERIVFVDDKIKNINAVKEAVESRGIEFVGLRYGRLDKKMAQIDLEKANKELDRFFETGCAQGMIPSSFLRMSDQTTLHDII